MLCTFCLRNKEPENIYRSHQLKGSDGLVTCPQLRRYRCELCGATGPNAHTRSYCPNATFNQHFRRPATGNQPSQGQRPAAGRIQRNGAPADGWLASGSSNGQHSRNHLAPAPGSQQSLPSRPAPPPPATTRSSAAAAATNGTVAGPCFYLGSERMFLNMARVTSTPHNSAGRLRRPRPAASSRHDY